MPAHFSAARHNSPHFGELLKFLHCVVLKHTTPIERFSRRANFIYNIRGTFLFRDLKKQKQKYILIPNRFVPIGPQRRLTGKSPFELIHVTD